MRRKQAIIPFVCALTVLILGASLAADEENTTGQKDARNQDLSVKSTTPDAGDPNMGDWQTDKGDLVAQVFPLGGGKYQANLLKKFDAREDPVAVLEGGASGEKIVFSGGGWSAEIASEMFKGRKGDEKFDMRRVTRSSPTLNAPPPKDALVLFDGTNLDEWTSQKPKEWETADGPANDWKIIPGGRLEVVPGAGSIITKKRFGDFKLHLEFRLLGGNINGGVYLMTRYELNIADSYGRLGGSQCGAFANLQEPLEPRVPAAAPAFQWQTLDVAFRAPRFDESGKVIEKARATVLLNGATIHDNVELGERKGAAKRLGDARTASLMLQEHGSPYQFRNIWIVDKTEK